MQAASEQMLANKQLSFYFNMHYMEAQECKTEHKTQIQVVT